jgi:hypothetical protein
MKKTVKLTESQLTSMIQNIVEQNRKLMNYREIKIINSEGQSELFDVSSVQPSRSGCMFSGRFRGSYDKLYDFFLSDSRYYQTKRGENYNDGLFYFEFKCDRPSNEFTLYHSGTASAIEPKLKYKLSPDAEKTLAGICKCDKYGAAVDVSGSTAVDKNPRQAGTLMSPLAIEMVNLKNKNIAMLNITNIGKSLNGCRFYGNERDQKVDSKIQFMFECGKFGEPTTIWYDGNDMGKHELTPEYQKALSDVCSCKSSGSVVSKPGAPQPLDPTVNKRVLNPGSKITENKKPIRLTEADIAELVRRVMQENK